jgi:hypothetical protein
MTSAATGEFYRLKANDEIRISREKSSPDIPANR